MKKVSYDVIGKHAIVDGEHRMIIMLIVNGAEKRIDKYMHYAERDDENMLKYFVKILDKIDTEVKKEDIKPEINIYTSEYSILNFFRFRWIKKWRRTNFTTNKGEPVIDKELWIKLDEYDSQYDFLVYDIMRNKDYNEITNSRLKIDRFAKGKARRYRKYQSVED